MHAWLARRVPKRTAGLLCALWYAFLLLQILGKAGVAPGKFLYRF